MDDQSVLDISAPNIPAEEIVRNCLPDVGLFATDYLPSVIRVRVDRGSLGQFCELALRAMNERTRTGARVLVTGDHAEPKVQEPLPMESLEALISRVRGYRIVEMLEAHRLTTWFQPIFSTTDRDRPVAYDGLMRGTTADGTILSPGDIIPVARKADLFFYLDREARISAIRRAGEHEFDRNELVFVNFNPTSIYTPENCLKTALDAIDKVGIDRARIVFEIVESDYVTDRDHLNEILRFYRSQGFKLALDDLGAGFNSPTSLSSPPPDFMKLDMELTRGVHTDPYRSTIGTNLLSLARQLSVTTIAEGVESEEEFEFLKSAGADLIQGFLLGRPHPAGRFT